jgi:hypothetical protein
MPLDELPPSDAATAPWPDIDPTLLSRTQPAPPPFPLELLPQDWRDWTTDLARDSLAPVDYAVQGLLAVVAAACGAGLVVRVTPVWSEPLLLWQAMVGTEASGHALAFAGAQGLLADLEPADQDVASPGVVADGTADSVREALHRCWRAALLWREELPDWWAEARQPGERPGWLAGWSARPALLNRRAAEPLRFHQFPICILGTLHPDRLNESLARGDDRLSARFLYSWPEPTDVVALDGRSSTSGRQLDMLKSIARLAEDDVPNELGLTPEAVRRLEEIVAIVRQRAREADGLEAAWIGNGPAMIVRIAALLALMHFAHRSPAPWHKINQISQPRIDDAWALWDGYFLPHARRVFGRNGRMKIDRLVGRTVGWLKNTRPTQVSREDIRSQALSRSVDAAGADEVIARLVGAGFLRQITTERPSRGPSPHRWAVNPALR